MMGKEPRQTTSNVGHLNKPSLQALIHGLDRHYYSINIAYRHTELEQKMLLNLYKKTWTRGLELKPFDKHTETNEQTIKDMVALAKAYNETVQQEKEIEAEKLAVMNVGKVDAKRRLGDNIEGLMASNITQTLGTMLDTVVFKQAEELPDDDEADAMDL